MMKRVEMVQMVDKGAGNGEEEDIKKDLWM